MQYSLKTINDKNSLQFDDKSKANVLNDQFASVFTEEQKDSIPEFPSCTDTTVPNLFITPAMVQKKLAQLDINKASGPDEISPHLLYSALVVFSKLIDTALPRITPKHDHVYSRI